MKLIKATRDGAYERVGEFILPMFRTIHTPHGQSLSKVYDLVDVYQYIGTADQFHDFLEKLIKFEDQIDGIGKDSKIIAFKKGFDPYSLESTTLLVKLS